jgi:hypothetical protein
VLELLPWQAVAGRGVQVRGPCLVHGSSSQHSRVFSAHLGRNVWQCFRCGASGNALDLWVRVTGQPLYPAVLAWYQHLGRTPPWLRARPSFSNNKDQHRSRESS